ncbi:MAG: hypothetical protein QM346_09075 [Chloroflexota bacterium]|nr:hypothetical protein [Chloroflexota bacterium]
MRRGLYLYRCLAFLIAVALGVGPGSPVAYATTGAANVEDELVYLDPDGVIRVLDPQAPAGNPSVAWSSPTGGWRYFALGDFNADGDMEIVAVGVNGGANRLAVFDPVAEGVSSGRADGVINGIPWVELYNVELPGEPLVVGAGNFALDRPGDEIVYVYIRPPQDGVQPGDPFRYVILMAEESRTDGRAWTTLLTFDAGSQVTWLEAGNINGTGADEIAVINRTGGSLSVFMIANGTLDRILYRATRGLDWVDGALGQFLEGGDLELAAVRETKLPFPSLYVIQYANANWTDAYSEYNDPPPDAVWFADITGNNDDEVVVLRRVPAEVGTRPHLFVRDNGNDVIRLGELRLDADNGYRTGTGGDFDGDGRDEIAIMRDSRIRIYTEPERSAEKVDFDVSTNSALIRAGNLDANGLADASRFAASPGMISDALPTGAVSAEHSVALSDAVNDRSFQFFVEVEDGAEWVRWTVSSSRTPAVLGVVFDAAGLPAGQYTERLVIDSDSEAVINTPVTVDLSLTVRDGLVVYPAEIVVPLHDCSEGAGAVQVQVAIDGTPGTGYTLQLEDDPAWVSVDALSGSVPGSATLTITPAAVEFQVETTALTARGVISETQATSRAPVVAFCVESTIHMPLVNR